MARALPSAIPPKMYRHFAVVTVLLTAGIAMFADGENREAAAVQVAAHERPEPGVQDSAAAPHKPAVASRTGARQNRFVQHSGGFDGFDASFGAPMDRALGSVATYSTQVASDVKQAGYSEGYLASLDPGERDRLLRDLDKEGMLAPEERERKSAALVAASRARSGGSTTADY